jgi:nucleotide-binding universal stress UspA family protein
MPWPPQNNIVVPVDFSDMCREALNTAMAIAGDPARVRVVYVLPQFSPVEPVMVGESLDDDLRIKHAKKSLAEWLAADKYERVTHEVVIGDAGHEIAHYASQVEADLIVMPSHGRTGLARVLLGSVAERTLRLAPCPVLVLRKPKEHS